MHKFGLPLVVALFVLVALVLWINAGRSSSGTGNPNRAFFVDEETGEEIVRPGTELPPLLGKAGNPTVVGAMKFGFKDNKTGNISDEQIVYLFKFTPEAQEALKTMDQHDPMRQEAFFSGQLVRSPQPDSDSEWVHHNSDEGRAIVALPNPPAGKHLVQIFPK